MTNRPVVNGPVPEDGLDGTSTGIVPDTTHRSPLRQAINDAIAEADTKIGLGDLTVLDQDPFRLDTPANHRDAQWLAETMQTLGLHNRTIHIRGLHYAILGQTKPDGSTYVNDEKNWEWLHKHVVTRARWLGYVPWDRVVDQRNDAPVVRIFEPKQPWPYVSAGVHVEIPDVDDIEPVVGIVGFEGVQPHKIVLVGEKSSLDDVLGPIAERYGADLYLPTGDISNTLIYQMAKIGAADGRRMVVLYFADADPSGWNMGVVVSRKLQAFKVLHFPGLEFEVHRVALTPDQVREFDLPSTPLKESEKRAAGWRVAFGVEQTEIDALATLRPELLRQLARDAIKPFYDTSLERRVREAKQDWIARAQAVVDNNTDQDHLDRLRADAEAKLSELQSEIDAINDALRVDADDFDLPPIEVPEPDLTHGSIRPEPLIDSDWDFIEQSRRLIDSKQYRDGGDG